MTSKEWASLNNDVRETIKSHQLEVPVKLSSIARALSVDLKSATLAVGISGEIRPSANDRNKFVIRINRHDAPRRQRFTVAHEIAHFLLHKQFIGEGLKDDVLYRSSLSDWKEAEANRLAADILMPQALIKEWLDNARLLKVEDPVSYLADQFEVSEASMKIRLGLS